MECCVIGTGYVGLVTGACLADMGNQVICVDKDREKIDMLGRGEIPIYEAGLESIVKRCLKNGKLKFTSTVKEAVHISKLIFITVDTPSDEQGYADLSHVDEVAGDIASVMNGYKIKKKSSAYAQTSPSFVKSGAMTCWMPCSLRKQGIRIPAGLGISFLSLRK